MLILYTCDWQHFFMCFNIFYINFTIAEKMEKKNPNLLMKSFFLAHTLSIS